MNKKIKKIVMFLMSFILTVTTCNVTVHAESITQAQAYSMGTMQSGVITENGDGKQYYRFELNSSGEVNIAVKAYMRHMYMYIYNVDAEELWRIEPYWNSTSEVITVDEKVYLTKGTYYLCFARVGSDGQYQFTLNFSSSNETYEEVNGGSNNSLDTASVLQVGSSCNGQISLNDEKDFYKFTIVNSGTVNWNAVFYDMRCVNWKLYDEKGEELLHDNPWSNTTTTNITVDEDLVLTAGTYYLCVSNDGNNYGKYTFLTTFTSANESYAETNGGSNNTLETASVMNLDKIYKGQIAVNDEKDFYKTSLPSDQQITLKINGTMEAVSVKLYDQNGNEIWSDSIWSSSVTKKISYSKVKTLEKGNYYLAIVQYGNYCGNYEVVVENLTQQNCTHDQYTSAWYDATYFTKGYRKYTCTTCGYSYKTDYSPVKVLPKGSISTWSSRTGKGWINPSWSTVYDASGYQVRYSRSKSMKNGVVTKTLKGKNSTNKYFKGLSKKKTYYVQVRAYKKSGRKIVYGAWSDKFKLKTK